LLEYLGCGGAAPPIYTPVAGLIPGGGAATDFFAMVGWWLYIITKY